MYIHRKKGGQANRKVGKSRENDSRELVGSLPVR
jgi:hypothetical protein